MVAVQVMGNDTADGHRRQPGQLRAERLHARHAPTTILQSVRLLADGIDVLHASGASRG